MEGDLIMAIDAREYIIAYIAYPDRKPRSFIVVFCNIGNETLPTVRSIVKYRGKSVTAKVTTTDMQAKITEYAKDEFEDRSVEAISLLCRVDER